MKQHLEMQILSKKHPPTSRQRRKMFLHNPEKILQAQLKRKWVHPLSRKLPILYFRRTSISAKKTAKRGDNSTGNAGVTSNDFEEPMEPEVNVENADERTETEEVVESSVPNPNAADAASTKESPEERLAQFPFARIKQMMKLDPEVGIVSAEAIFLVTKAAELFLQTLAKDTSFHTVASKKKTMSKRDVETAIDNVDSLVFLEGMMNV
ncbi:DNA polymerase epsilon subunit 4 [Anopheles arabiensis]|uniref:DNA polymerase epsilon subunit 4 n=1 Tax=Anopheles arabiensis TaxID=7173 RepID=UPI001AAD947C|nr:DNA polymerase epsilon subunit 4 [Anopheles arabiensis]